MRPIEFTHLEGLQRELAAKGIDVRRGVIRETTRVNGETIKTVELPIPKDAMAHLNNWERKVLHVVARGSLYVADDDALLARVQRGEGLSPGDAARVRRIRVEWGELPPDEDAEYIPAYAALIDQLIAEHKLDRRPAYHWSNMQCMPWQRVLWLWAVRSAEDFAVSLHELGHVLTEDGRNLLNATYARGEMIYPVAEIAAWRWARETAERIAPAGWTPAMHREMTVSLRRIARPLDPEYVKTILEMVGVAAPAGTAAERRRQRQIAKGQLRPS